MKENRLFLQIFADPVGPTETTQVVSPINVTGQDTMSVTMKTFYDTAFLENARDEMVLSQFSKKQPMHGNKVEWRKFNTFPKAMTPLQEGVIPTGQTFGMTSIEATTTQHGDFVAVSDRLELEAYDDVIFGATEEMGAAGGSTWQTLTRNIICAGKSVAYGGAAKERSELTAADKITPTLVNKVATFLKKNKAPKIGGYYIGLVHPSVAEDLRESEEWKEFHKYNDVAPIFKGEIGTLHGIRFIEWNEAKVVKQGELSVYQSLFLGKDAFGELEVDGESMETIIKGREQAGGPLNQFSTIGYKFVHGAKILYEERMLRLETASSYNDDAN